MNPGDYRHQMTIQLVTEGHQIAGSSDDSTTDVATVWCSLRPLSSREINYAKEIYADASFEIRLHYYSGLTSAHRFKFGDRIFNLSGRPIDPTETRVEHVCMCKEAE